jgi:hypothetical protein
MNENMSFKQILSLLADTITIVGLIWAAGYGFFKKHKNLIAFRINEFFAFLFKAALIAIVGIFVFHISATLYNLVLVITKGETQGELWEKGHEFAHILGYFISGAIGLTVMWFVATIIWTGSFVFLKNIWDKSKIKLWFDALSDADNLILENAEYKTPNKSINVTEKLSKMISKNQLTITASNDLAGDPELGTEKVLVIKYRFGKGNSEIIEIPETKTITIRKE